MLLQPGRTILSGIALSWLLSIAVANRIDALRDSGAVVSGKVVAVENVPGEGTRATIKINHVYQGSKSLKGLALFDYTADGGSGNLAFPLLKVGEEGIWLMGTDQNTDTLHVVGRYRKDHTKNYDRRVDWAETLERLQKLDVAKRLELAQELCGHKTPEVAQLGVGILFAAEVDDAERANTPRFLKNLAKNLKASHSALVCADRLFEHRDGKMWVGSEQQKSLFSRFTEVMSEADAVEVVNHILRTRYRESPDGTALTAGEATTLLVTIAKDSRQANAVRQIAVGLVIEAAGNAGVRDGFTFETLATVIGSGTDDATRLLAAKGLARFKWRAAAQFEVLRALLNAEKNAEIQKSLATAISGIK